MAEVETDKAVMEMPAYDEGVLLVQLVKEGDLIPVGAPVAIIGAVGEDVTALIDQAKTKLSGLASGTPPEPVTQTAEPKSTPSVEPSIVPSAATSSESNAPAQQHDADTEEFARLPSGGSAKPGMGRHGRILASPLARKIAEERGVDIARVKGSGPGGRITKQDVLSNISGGAGAPIGSTRPDKRVEISNMRRVIANRLHDAKNNIPHFYLTLEFNAKALVEIRDHINRDLAATEGETAPKITYNDLITKACAIALQKHPIVNSSFRGDHIIEHGRVDIGIAVAIEGGLITPYVRNADQIPIISLSAQIRDLTKRARERKLRTEEFTDGCFTISNLGMFGITHFSAIINEPEAALLAVGGLLEKAVVENGQLVPGKTMTLTLSCDHRVVDGAEGARFLQTLQNLLEHPQVLLMK